MVYKNFKALLSKGLRIAIIAGSLLVKVMANKSGKGVSMMGVLLDLTAITFHMSYSFMNGYPFNAWRDNTFLALRTAAIGALLLHYSGQKGKSLLFCAAYAAFVYVLNSGLTPMRILIAAKL